MGTLNQMVSSSDFQKQRYKYMDEVTKSREPRFIMRRSRPEAVLLDLETYQEMLASLDQLDDRVRFEEAVQALAQAAQPSGGLLHRRPPAGRVAAIEALGQAGGAPALRALEALTKDRDKTVRAAAERAFGTAPK